MYTDKPLPGSVTILTLILLPLLAFASFCGAFLPVTYSLETPSLAAQGVGQDLINLFLVVPSLAIALYMSRKGSLLWMLVLAGALFYTLYSYVIYALGIHFNYLFLVYCAVLGLSVYLFIILFTQLSSTYPPDRPAGYPSKSTAWFLIVVAVIFALLWLKDIVPAIAGGYTPASVTDYNLLVNPVHVIDLAFALPGLVITAVLLLRGNHLGLILAPIAILFMVFMALALAAMVLLTISRGITEDASVAVIFVILTAVSIFFLVRLFRAV